MNILDSLTDEQIKSFHVEDFWRAYKKAVYPGVKLRRDQAKECKNAMMAGIHAGFEFMALVSCRLAEDDAMAAIDNFHKELIVIARASNPTGEN